MWAIQRYEMLKYFEVTAFYRGHRKLFLSTEVKSSEYGLIFQDIQGKYINLTDVWAEIILFRPIF